MVAFSSPTVPLALLMTLGSFGGRASAGTCPDDADVDLCDDVEADVDCAPSLMASSWSLAFPLALALRSGGAKHAALLPLLAPLAGWATPVAGMTCGELKTHYKSEACCGSPEKELSQVPGAGACPYNFAKPACDDAEPQAPRDLTANAEGQMTPKAAVLNQQQASSLPLVNVHFHLGAEHKAEAYSNATDIDAWNAERDGSNNRRLAASAVQPGFMCDSSDLNTTQTAPYQFQYCKGEIAVGTTYEVHYVHSSAGYAYPSPGERQVADIDGIEDGLGGAANGRGLLNPMIVVQGQVFQIVQGGETVDDLLHGWTVVDHSDSVMYAGSTTGPSHNNTVCSPYSITWHVDKACHRVSPESFDNLCKQMQEYYAMESDLYPHGSRTLVDPKYVVHSQYVVPLA